MSSSTSTSRARRTRVFGSLCLLVFLVNFGRVVFAPLLDPFMQAFGVGPAEVGLVATLAWLGSAVARIPTGYVLTRVARHRVILATGIFLTAAAFGTAFADSVLPLGLGAFLIGTCSGAYFIAANPFVSELFPERVGRVIGIHGTASQLAAVVAPLSVGFILAMTSWRTVFFLLAAVALVGSVAFSYAARRATLPDAGTRDRHLVRSVRNQWRIVLAGVAIMSATGFVWNGLFNFYVPYVTAAKGIDPSTAQILLTVIFAAGVPAFWYTGRLADRFPHIPLMLSVLGGFVVCLFAFTVVQGLPGLVVVTIMMGYVIHSLFPAMDTYLLDSLPDADRASAYAAYSGAMMLIQATASVVVGTLVQFGYTYDTVFQTFGIGLVAILLGLLVLYNAGHLPTGARQSPSTS